MEVAEKDEELKLNYVQETVLKKRKVNHDWVTKKREGISEKKRKRIEVSNKIIKRPEDFVREYRQKELDLIRMKCRLKRRKCPIDSIKSKLLFVIRIRGSKDMHPKSRKILGKLRLNQILSGVFLKVSEGTMRMLLMVEPFVTYGFPNMENVKDLIYKKGSGMLNKQHVALTNNDIIEQALGKYGIICLDDIVHEIYNVGPRFKEVVSFLTPFKLKCPEGRLEAKSKLFKDGGDCGNREYQINEFINKLN